MVRLICLRLLRIQCHDDFSVELHDRMTRRNTIEQLAQAARIYDTCSFAENDRYQ